MLYAKKHKLFIVLFIVLSVYLGLKTLPEDGWSGWAFGSAQTMMTTKHWVNDGMIYSKFLFTPIGYSKAVRYLDEPEMRHHARGSVTGELTGRHFYYTHYPSGYLIPYGLLAKIGFEERYWFRLLALVFSLAGLSLMYALFYLLANKTIAFLATFYYAGSTMFLSYADSLANQPIDDFFRFLILLISVLAIRSVSDVKKHRIYNIFIWIFYFLLASSSYDSTFFIFIWLVGLDIVTFRKFLWKKWLFFASAPVFSFGLQMLQNWWYFGNWHEVWLDLFGAGIAQVQTSSIFRHINQIFYTFSLMTGLKIFLAGFLAIVLFSILWKIKNKSDYLSKLLPISIILFLAGAAYPFVFAGSGGFSYQGRQTAPFLGLLLGSGLYSAIRCFFATDNRKKWISRANIVFGALFLLVVVFWVSQIYRTVDYVREWPNNQVSKDIIDFSKSLKKTVGDKDTITFCLDENSPDRYPQIAPLVEYYVGTPVLSFKRIPDLIHDYKWLKNRSEYEFYSIILSANQENTKELMKLFGGSKDVSVLTGPSLIIDFE